MSNELADLRSAVQAVHQWLELEGDCPPYPQGMSRTSFAAAEFRAKWRADCMKLHIEAAKRVREVAAKYPVP
jgi:hypothetical protein